MSSKDKDQRPIRGVTAVIASLFESGRYSDLSIICKGRAWPVHRNVICPQSKVLSAMVDSHFKESITSEINLPDDDPKTVHHLIHFLYKETFDDIDKPPTLGGGKERSRLTNCTKVYIMAEVYDVPALKELAMYKFKNAVGTDWNNGTLATCLAMMYTELPESDRLLKDVAIKAALEHFKELVDTGEFVEVCKAHGEVAFDMLNLSFKQPPPKPTAPPVPTGVCRYCGPTSKYAIHWDNCQSQFLCNNCGRRWV
ncbi:hypothetical protein BDZ45DRAFT_657540 [Acephala macrosclerotiorum]|nr:hypothetical protein BDZ45DRAFT_657540 [Acephala macrosclerotiorum]